MRMDNLAPLFRPTIGVDRPLHAAADGRARPRRQGLRWISAIHRGRQDDDDDPPPAPAAMRLAVPHMVEPQGEAGPAMLRAA